MFPCNRISIVSLGALMFCGTSAWAAHPSQGLWVGEVALNAVNEATGAVGNSNTYEFKAPEILTPTADTAFLRLILHVNGAGQVSLLKSVAIVEPSGAPGASQEVILLTDPSLYSKYPGVAKRIATAFFDFGDQQAVTAVQTLIDTSTQSAVARAMAGDSASAVEARVLTDLAPVKDSANVDLAYLNRATGSTSFITSNFFTLAQVQSLADEVARLITTSAKQVSDFDYELPSDTYSPFPIDPLGGVFANRVLAARNLSTRSSYRDMRGFEAIAGVVMAAADAVGRAAPSASPAQKQALARIAAESAWHNAADLGQAYNRFLASAAFTGISPVIPGVAGPAAILAKGRGRSQGEIAAAVRAALLQKTEIADAYTAAAGIAASSLWQDPRPRRALDTILDAASNAAAAQVMTSILPTTVAAAVESATKVAVEGIKAAPVFLSAPTGDYTQFVTASGYQSAVATAAKSAAAEAVFQFKSGVTAQNELKFFTERAVTKALATVRADAAALPQYSLILGGRLLPGGSVTGTLHLPALAPTNPFMHRRHPDHTEGYAITRKISIQLDSAEPGSSGYGVSKLTGVYQEELFGLHKPLGSNKDVGLRTKGNLTLSRITFADTLNF